MSLAEIAGERHEPEDRAAFGSGFERRAGGGSDADHDAACRRRRGDRGRGVPTESVGTNVRPAAACRTRQPRRAVRSPSATTITSIDLTASSGYSPVLVMQDTHLSLVDIRRRARALTA